MDVEKHNSNFKNIKTVTSTLKPNQINSENTSPIDHFANEGDFSSLKFDNKFSHPNKQYGIDINGYINNDKLHKQTENDRSHQMKLSDYYKPIHVSQIQAISSDERRYKLSSRFGEVQEDQDSKLDVDHKNYCEDPQTAQDLNFFAIKEEQNLLQEKANKEMLDEYNDENTDKIHHVLKTITTSSNEYRVRRTIDKNVTSDSKDSTLSGIGIKIDMQRLNRLNEAPEFKKKSSTAYDGLKRRKREILK